MQNDAELKQLAPAITADGKTPSSAQEVRAILIDALANGWEYLPYGECNNFDPKHGCRGHALTSDGKEVKA